MKRKTRTGQCARAAGAMIPLSLFAAATDAQSEEFLSIWWTDAGKGTIERADPDGSNRVVVVSGLNVPIDLAIDFQGDWLYWVSDGFNDVRRRRMHGGAVTSITSSSEPRGLALDLASGHAYGLDRTDDLAYRVDLDGSNRVTLSSWPSSPCYIPLSIALDLPQGEMYWTDACQQGIFRANLDGSGQMMLVSGQADVRGLALDLEHGKLYWVTFDWIRCSDLDGSNVADLVDVSSSFHPNLIALDVEDGRLYWTQQSSIRRARLDGTSPETFVTGLCNASGLVLQPRPCPEGSQITALETPLNSTPPNPTALLAGTTRRPILGESWDPRIDHAAFAPAAVLDLVVVEVGRYGPSYSRAPSPPPSSRPVIGLPLCSPSAELAIFFARPGFPFRVPIPEDCALLGTTSCAQGGSLLPGGELAWTNGFTLTLGNR